VTVYNTVTEQVAENYTVCVPVHGTKEVQVQVCRPVAVEVTVPVVSGGAGYGVISGGQSAGAGCSSCN
jgi:hypothetical protein